MPEVVPAVALPAPSGSHQVGRRNYAWFDAGRQRTLRVWVYYPAWLLDSLGDEPVLADSAWAAVHRDEIAGTLGLAAAQGLRNLRTAARTDAPLEGSTQPYPVLLFAPARGWLPTDYSALIEAMASRGFVVVAFAPPGDAATVCLPDGELIPVKDADASTNARIAGDFSFVAEHLRALDRSHDWPFRGALDFRRLGVVGNGVGGTAALLAAWNDSTLTAAASIDGDFFGLSGAERYHQPLLYLSTQPPGLTGVPLEDWNDKDRTERRRAEQWDLVSTDSRLPLRARVMGMANGNILDAAMLPGSITHSLRGMTRFGAIAGERGIQLSASVLDDFFTEVFTGTARRVTSTGLAFPEAHLSR